MLKYKFIIIISDFNKMGENFQLEPSLTRLIRATMTDYIDELIAKNDEQKSN
jgi:hypothetical protein